MYDKFLHINLCTSIKPGTWLSMLLFALFVFFHCCVINKWIVSLFIARTFYLTSLLFAVCVLSIVEGHTMNCKYLQLYPLVFMYARWFSHLHLDIYSLLYFNVPLHRYLANNDEPGSCMVVSCLLGSISDLVVHAASPPSYS